VISQHGVVDDDSGEDFSRHNLGLRLLIELALAHNQATVLRAEAPIFNPRDSGVDELVLLTGPQQPDSVGLKASIHAPQNGDISQTQGRVGVSGSMHAIRRACAPATSSENTSDSLGASETASDSSLRASVHAPQHLSTGAHQGLEANVEKLETQLTRSASSSSTDDGPQSGLTASIHAPRRCPPLEAAQRSSQHSADAPNWATAARAEDSSTTSGVSVTAQRDNSPDPALGDYDGSELPTATRCAIKDQEEGSVDSSDGSLDYADDQEGTTTGSGETDGGLDLDEADDPNEQDSSPQSQRTRRRGKSRRHRQKLPYLPPPRMRLGHLMQHSVVDVFAAQTQPPNALAAPPPPRAPLSGQYYSHLPPPPSHDPTLALRRMAPPPIGIIPNQLGPHPHYHHPRPMGSPHSAGLYPPPIPVFPPPGPYTPTFYPHGPHPQYLSPQAPFTPLYGR
jgi:hypothetical protein